MHHVQRTSQDNHQQSRGACYLTRRRHEEPYKAISPLTKTRYPSINLTQKGNVLPAPADLCDPGQIHTHQEINVPPEWIRLTNNHRQMSSHQAPRVATVYAPSDQMATVNAHEADIRGSRGMTTTVMIWLLIAMTAVS
jgi:hypothetical protein